MGGNASTQRAKAQGAERLSRPDAMLVDEGAAASQDSLGEEQLSSLRVKDPDAWKSGASPRPRSALKHGSGPASAVDSEASGGLTEGGRRSLRKVSFQVQGLAAPMGEEGTEGHQAHKRVRGSEEFSMKFLVDRFYSKVLTIEELKPFFDGVDMRKLKHQQEALMLLVFGGQELLDDELPGLSADLRLIHLHLLFEGLNLSHWQLFADKFTETLDELHQLPEEVRGRAKAIMRTTKHHFRPIEAHEWPPKVVYKGWTKKTCPFHTSNKSLDSLEGLAADVDVVGEGVEEDDDDAFVLPGINHPAVPGINHPAVPVAAAAGAAVAEAAAEVEAQAVAEAEVETAVAGAAAGGEAQAAGAGQS